MILVTGAAGFVGRALVQRLLDRGDALTLVDTQGLDEWAGQAGVTCVLGSIAERAVLERAVAGRPRTVFHLASVPGGRAEQDYALGRSVNLDATAALLELLAQQAAPVLVFASSIAVFGGPLPDPVPEHQPPRPLLSYGAHKLVGEILVADFARRGWVDGRSVRLPGIVARPAPPPGQVAGAISMFLSDLIRDLPRGLAVTVPMSPGATTWLMSCARAVDNLLWAAGMPIDRNDTTRVWTPPPLCVSMAALVEAIAAHHGRSMASLVRYAPVAAIEAAFGANPALAAPDSRAAGFQDDGTLADLIARGSNPR